MNRILVVMLLVGAVAFISCNYLEGIDVNTIPAIMKNTAMVDAHVACLKNETVKCDKTGSKLRGILPELLTAGGCTTKCTESDKQWMVYILTKLKELYPKHYEDLLVFYKVTDPQKKKLDEFVAATTLPAGV